MPGLLQRFLPREESFFDLFAKQAANIHVGADALHKMLSHYTGVPEQVQIVKAIEHPACFHRAANGRLNSVCNWAAR